MSDLIVLGFIPGTHIQITFLLWFLVVSGLAASLMARYLKRKRLLRNLIIATSFALTIRRPI
jgi:hypothetical protein